ncbi:hypothetical protein TNCV_88511 [Trichonephila clavipes]|nr:hypothetical protein TNCV_88511 [Trichonephila clavipes]
MAYSTYASMVMGTSPCSLLEIKCDRGSQTALARPEYLKSLPRCLWSGTKPEHWRALPVILREMMSNRNIEKRDLENSRMEAYKTATDVVQSGRPIFDDFFQHLWPYIGNNTVNVVFQMVKRLWLIRLDQ